MSQFDPIQCISPIDGRYQTKTAALQNYFSESALIKYRCLVECKWFEFLADSPEIQELDGLGAEARQFLQTIYKDFSIENAHSIKEIEQKTNHDVKAVEYFLQQQFQQQPELSEQISFIHFACTSEDINNVSYALMMHDSWQAVLRPTLFKLIKTLQNLAHQHASQPMLARTHGQPASPTTVGKEFANITYRLQRAFIHLDSHQFSAKFNGATGNYHAHQVAYPQANWPIMAENFLESLQLTTTPYTTQIEPHDNICVFFSYLQQINNVLIDAARDIWGYIGINYFRQKTIKGEVGSSTMPHKVNPIDFENAEGNLGLANALLKFFIDKLPISRWQRDLSDSTTLRNIGVALAHSHLAYLSLQKGLDKLELNKTVLDDDLANQWSLLAEPIQTIMRKFGIADAYDQLKDFSRGKQLTQQDVIQFVQGLAIPQEAKQQLLQLTPNDYLGLAETLATEC